MFNFNLIDKIPALNSKTNFFTLLLYIAYSIVRRFVHDNRLLYFIGLLFVLNALFTLYILFKANTNNLPNYKNLKPWIIFRLIANIGFAVLIFTYY